MKIRKPAVADRFYPGSKIEIISQLSKIIEKEMPGIDMSLAGKEIIGAVLPHAGYMFSAYQAVHFFEILRRSSHVFDTFFIINPNHTGYGPDIAIDENDHWETPLGSVPIDEDFYTSLGFPKSEQAHKYEHSGEVLVPMLKYFLSYTFKIVPITILKQTPENAALIANEIAAANARLKKRVCLLASSDFSHFKSPEDGYKADQFVLDEIVKFNPQGIFEQVRDKHISVCGYGPIMTLIEYAKLAATNPTIKVLKRGHSGEVIPSDEVVDYISMLLYAD